MEYMDIETVKELDHVFGDIEELQKFRCLMMQYECAMLEVKTKLDVLNTELSVQNSRNPIESIKCRIKEPDSIMKKMKRQEIPFSVDNIEKNLNDIAGVRVICSFPDDIYTLAGYLEKQDDIKLIKKKDYISHPKPNGYRSLHLILEVPIFLTNEKKMMRVEVQFRTIAMDFWASLEHKIAYKFEGNPPDYLETELKACADMVDMLDAKMFSLNQAIMEIGWTRREEAEKKLEEERLQEEARQQAQRAREIVEGQKAGQGTEPENGGKA